MSHSAKAANRIKQEAGFPFCFPDETAVLNYEEPYNSESKHDSKWLLLSPSPTESIRHQDTIHGIDGGIRRTLFFLLKKKSWSQNQRLVAHAVPLHRRTALFCPARFFKSRVWCDPYSDYHYHCMYSLAHHVPDPYTRGQSTWLLLMILFSDKELWANIPSRWTQVLCSAACHTEQQRQCSVYQCPPVASSEIML